MVQVFSGVIIVLFGILGIIATKQKVKYFCDPPSEWWLCYPQALIKKVFGVKYVIGFNYFVGIIFILSGLYILYEGYQTLR